jgi:hypothetical protein
MTSDGAYGLTIYPAGNGVSATNIFTGTMDNHGVLLSSDTAATWQSEGLAIAFDGIEDLKAANGELFALTVGQEIWYRPLSEMISSVNEISGTTDGLLLKQNYPNPVINSSAINYVLPNGVNEGEIVFYNFQDKEVKRFKVDRTINTLLISAKDIAAGTYFYQLQTTLQNSEGKKMVVIK